MTNIYIHKSMFVLTDKGYAHLREGKPELISDENGNHTNIDHLKSDKNTPLISIETNVGETLNLHPNNRILVFDFDTQRVKYKKVSQLTTKDSILRYKHLKDNHKPNIQFARLCSIFYKNHKTGTKYLLCSNSNEAGFVKKYFDIKQKDAFIRKGSVYILTPSTKVNIREYLDKYTPINIVDYFLKSGYGDRHFFVDYLLRQYTPYRDRYYTFKYISFDFTQKLQMLFTSIGYRTLLRYKSDGTYEIRVYTEKYIEDTLSKKHLMNTLVCEKRLIQSLIDNLSYELNDTTTIKKLKYMLPRKRLSEDKLYHYYNNYNLPEEWMEELLDKHYIRILNITQSINDTFLFKTKSVIANNYKIVL